MVTSDESRPTGCTIDRRLGACPLANRPIHNFDDVAEDPQVEALGVFRRTEVNERPVFLVNHPIRYDHRSPNCEPRGSPSANPRAKSLPSTDYTQAQIDGLFARGVVGGPSNTNPDGAQGASGAVTA